MDPTELGRWTRFAVKGGIGKCTAVQDCIAKSPDDLMFMQGDEIVVLMHLQDQHDTYLGYCEGVVGKFEGTSVKFHSKLKRPVVAKRSSAASSPAPSSRPSSKSPAPSPRTAPSSLSNHEAFRDRSISTSVEFENHTPASHSLDLTVSAFDSVPSQLINPSSSSSTADSISATSSVDLNVQVDPDLCSPNQNLQLHDESTSYPVHAHDIPENSFASEQSTRISVATYDGMEGIGLSLLQDFMAGNGDDSSSEASDVHTPEPGPSHSPESTIEVHGLVPEPVPTELPLPAPVTEVAAYPLETASRLSSNPSDYSEYNEEEWEGASDIYDNYRYSRFSVASKMSRYSKPSMHTPPPIPTDHQPPSIDSIASAAKRLEHSEPSPLLRTRFPTPPTSPSEIAADLNSSAPLSSERSIPMLRERSNSQSSRAQLLEVQTHLTRGYEAQLVAQSDEKPSSSKIVNRHAESVYPASEEGRKSQIDDEKRSEVISTNSPVINSAPPSYLPSEGLSSSESQQSFSSHNIPAISPPVQPLEPLSPARPRQKPEAQHPNLGLDFGSSRTSVFLPHPGAPKAPTTVPSGPLYGRAQQQPPVHPPSSEYGNSRELSSLLALLRAASTVQYYSNGSPRQTTIYGKCEIDLMNSGGPVPISWSLEPPMSVPANRVPIRSQTTPHITQLLSSPLHDSSRPSATTSGEFGNVGRFDDFVSNSPSTNSVLNVLPQSPELRRRSRSFSGLDKSLQVSEPTSLPATHPSSIPRIRSSDDSGMRPRTSDSRNSPQIARAHQPSPLSLPQNTTKRSSHESVKLPLSSTSFPRSSSQSIHTVQISSESLSTSSVGLNGSSQQPLRQAISNTPLRPSGKVSTTSTVTLVTSGPSPVTLQASSMMSLFNSGMPMSPALPRGESPSTPLSPTSPQAFEMFESPLNSPRPSVSSSHGHSLNLPSHSLVTGTAESPAATKSASGRNSMDTETSRSSETRNQSFVSPSSTTTSSASAPPTSSGVPKNLSLRSKLSLSAIRAKSVVSRVESQDEGSSPITPIHWELRDFETVQVEDMDFELIKPHLQRASSPQPSLYSLGGRPWDFNSQSSPVKPDGASFLQVESPTTSVPSPAISDYEVPLHANLPFGLASSSNLATSNNPDSMSRGEMEAHRHRELKWVSLMSTVPPAQAKKSKKVKKLLLEGVPASVRYQVWAHLADCKAKRMNGLYSQLVKRGKVPASSTIEHDVVEFFCDQPQSKDGSVLSVLQAYLNMVPDVQYNRGLTCIVGQLLAQAPEEDAFWIFISMMDSYLRPYFALNHIQIEIDALLFAKAVEANYSAVAKKVFVDMGIPPAQICRLWFSTLFFDALPPEYHLRIWDVFLFEGIPFLLRIGLALFSCCHRAFLETTDQGHVISILSRIPLAFLPSNPDALVELAMSVKLKDDDVRKHRSKMEAQLKRQTQNRMTKPIVNGGGAAISLPRR